MTTPERVSRRRSGDTRRARCGRAGLAPVLLLAGVLASAALAAEAADQGAPPAAAGAPQPYKRPRICVVLSGGGARGAAHVGVLKVLEEYHVPVDCIAGTSMGSLIGGAYATGMTVAQMEEITASISTELLFKEAPPRTELSMRRKEDDYGLFVGPEIGLKGGKFNLAKGVVTGVQLETVLRRLSQVHGYQKFDSLPIPFRAVATDLVTGKEVVFKEGELANVMRASMSVPGAVAPAEYEGMMLVDGMLTSNLPVDAARQMHPDIIIAVNVGTPLLKREQLDGILGVTSQMLSILTEQNVQASIAELKPTDILITPDLADFSTSDFDHLPQITPLGEAAARKVADRLAQLSIPADEYAALRQRQQIEVPPDARVVDAIRIEPMQVVNPEVVKLAMDTKIGEPINTSVLDADMRRIYGLGDFEHVSYKLIEDPDDKRVIVVDAQEKSGGPDVVRFGLGLSSDFSGDAFFDLVASYRKYWINSLGGEWRVDAQVGHTAGLETEFYQPLDVASHFFIAPNLGARRTTTYLYQGDDRIATYNLISRWASLNVGTQFSRFGTLRVGVLEGRIDPELDTGPPSLSPGPPANQSAFTGGLLLDQLDSVHFPRAGWRVAGNVYNSNTKLGAVQNYTRWDVAADTAYSIGPNTFNFAFKAGGPLGADPLPKDNEFQWGGFLQQSGYRTGQFYGQNLTFGRFMYYARVFRGGLLEGAYGGFSLEAGRVGQPLVPGNPDGLLKSMSLFIAADSPIGPAYLGYGHAAGGTSSFYFFLGRAF